MTDRFNREKLFKDYFGCLDAMVTNLERRFFITGIRSQLFGAEPPDGESPVGGEIQSREETYVRESLAWNAVDCLADYALDGRLNGQDPGDILVGGQDILDCLPRLMTPFSQWCSIVELADARFGLDSGEPLDPEALALLGNVDVRTVRNAISASELVATKVKGKTSIDHISARSWLSGRRGFKATNFDGPESLNFSAISTAPAFGKFLVAQKERLGLETSATKPVVGHPAVDAKTFSELESGVFKLPIDAVFPLADFYQVDRKAFLSCVMRTFFPEQLSAIQIMFKTE